MREREGKTAKTTPFSAWTQLVNELQRYSLCFIPLKSFLIVIWVLFALDPHSLFSGVQLVHMCF